MGVLLEALEAGEAYPPEQHVLASNECAM